VLPAAFACFLYESVHDGDGVGLRLWGTSPLGLYAAGEDLRASSDPRWLWRDRLVDGLGVLVVFAPVAWCSARRRPFARWAAVSFATGFVVLILNEPLEADHVTTVAAAVVAAAVVAAVAAARRLGAGPRAVRA
jgi:hypothetical protein